MDDNNPITVQVLNLFCTSYNCSVKPAVVMSISAMAVMAASNVIISLLRNLIPNRINYCSIGCSCFNGNFSRSSFKPFAVSAELSIFIGLIITNCIVMGRLEAFALGMGMEIILMVLAMQQVMDLF